MRRFIGVVCTSILLFTVPTAVYAEENPNEQAEQKQHKGLVRGLLHQVKDTVDKTVKSTGDLVEETVSFTGDTVERTVNLTTETVKTVTDPKEKKPVKKIVENTTNFVGETVEKTAPVVEQTTKTVETAVNETVKVTKPLPKVPVVTPVVDKTTETVNKVTEETKKTVDKTVGTVTETVSKPLKKEPVKEKQPAEEEKPAQQPVNEQPAVTEKPAEKPIPSETEKTPSAKPETAEPSKPAKPESPAVIVPTEEKRPEAAQPKAEAAEQPSADERTSKETAAQNEAQSVNSFAVKGIEPIDEQFTMESKQPEFVSKTEAADEKASQNAMTTSNAVPLKPGNDSAWMPKVELITGATSISVSAPATSASAGGIGAVLSDDWHMKEKILHQKWYAEDILGVLQWSHAPPGQPPQSTPFLYVS